MPSDLRPDGSSKPQTRQLPPSVSRRACLSGLLAACTHSTPRTPSPSLLGGQAGARIERRGDRLTLGSKSVGLLGINYWAAVADAVTPEGKQRVAAELDRLCSLGVRALRITAAAEGPDREPWRIAPSLQPQPGVFNEPWLKALGWLLEQMEGRGLYAVLTLNNFWFWSGGMAQYLAWAHHQPVVYPNMEAGTGWDAYQDSTAEFFESTRAQELFNGTLETLIPRYRDSSAILAWELANEPRGRKRAPAYRRWLDRTAHRVKRLDPTHLVTTGSEGDTSSPENNGMSVFADHQSDAIDIVSFHVWPENWNWIRRGAMAASFEPAVARAERYVRVQTEAAARLGKPALLLETGIARDDHSFVSSSATSYRDRYFAKMLQLACDLRQQGAPLHGVLPWAWSGVNQPLQAGVLGRSGPYTGDPPHERQGWYSIYDQDADTLATLKAGGARLNRGWPRQRA